jgi:hypothetical protein
MARVIVPPEPPKRERENNFGRFTRQTDFYPAFEKEKKGITGGGEGNQLTPVTGVAIVKK